MIAREPEKAGHEAVYSAAGWPSDAVEMPYDVVESIPDRVEPISYDVEELLALVTQ